MKEYVFYGDEKVSEAFLDNLVEEGFPREALFEQGVAHAASTFVDVALRMDYRLGEDYYPNIGSLCFALADKYPSFAEHLMQEIKRIDPETVPSRAAVILYGF